jgi:hypothetical protein
MAIPLNYIARNLWSRRLTTALTAGGLAMVVFVFATVLMLDNRDVPGSSTPISRRDADGNGIREKVIDGKAVAAKVRGEVAERTKQLFEKTGIRAGLAVIIVGEDPASEVYVANKHRACEEAGMHSLEVVMPATTTRRSISSAR